MRAETSLQRVVTSWLNIQERLGRLWWPTPNGTQVAGGTPQERAKRIAFLKRAGMLRPGVPDLFVLLSGCRLIAIELKVGRGKPTPEQLDFGIAIEHYGATGYICRSLGEVQRIVEPLIAPRLAVPDPALLRRAARELGGMR